MFVPDSSMAVLAAVAIFAAYGVELFLIVEHRQTLCAIGLGSIEIEGGVPGKIVSIVFRGRTFGAIELRLRDGQKCEFLVVTQSANTVSIGTSTTRRDDALECLKLRSLLRLVRSSSRVRIRSRPISVLPVKKSALMLGAGPWAVSSLGSFCIVSLACCMGFASPRIAGRRNTPPEIPFLLSHDCSHFTDLERLCNAKA